MKLFLILSLLSFSALADVNCKAAGLTGTATLKLTSDKNDKTVYRAKLGTVEFLASINHKSASDDYFVVSISDDVRGKPLWTMAKYAEIPATSSVMLFSSGYMSVLTCERK